VREMTRDNKDKDAEIIILLAWRFFIFYEEEMKRPSFCLVAVTCPPTILCHPLPSSFSAQLILLFAILLFHLFLKTKKRKFI